MASCNTRHLWKILMGHLLWPGFSAVDRCCMQLVLMPGMASKTNVTRTQPGAISSPNLIQQTISSVCVFYLFN